MSGKLDQSLAEITSTSRRVGGRRTQRRSAIRAKAAIAPSAGVKKTIKPARKSGAKTALIPTGPAKGDSKVIVSNLPKDVTEQQIKEYFIQSVGSIKRVELVYGPNGQSKGIANVSFRDTAGAGKAFQKLNGLLVDQRPIKIEMVVSTAQAAALPTAKTLAERTTQPKTQPKAQPKSAAAVKKGAAAKNAGKAAKKGKARSARPVKKTDAELDADMADYFVANAENTNAAAPAAPAAGGEAMDEIM